MKIQELQSGTFLVNDVAHDDSAWDSLLWYRWVVNIPIDQLAQLGTTAQDHQTCCAMATT